MITEITETTDRRLDTVSAPALHPILLADWTNAAFIHFSVTPELLRPHIPAELELDVIDGKAFVSLVAFTQRRLRPTWGGRLSEVLSAPLAQHPFLNLRTYVRRNGERGIFFIAEWIPNRLATLIGPRTYGLPYRLAEMSYRTKPLEGSLSGTVSTKTGSFDFNVINLADATEDRRVDDAREVSRNLDAFLLERYTAWTHRNGVLRRFRIHHEPWPQRRATSTITDRTLLDRAAPWLRGIRPIFAHRSPGVFNVAIGRPEREHRAAPVAQKLSLFKRFGPLLVMVPAALLLRNRLPAWTFMWVVAITIFAGCKWLTLADAIRTCERHPTLTDRLGYLLAWVGMDAKGFFDRTPRSAARPIPRSREWAQGILNVLAGAAFFWLLARLAMPAAPYLAGCLAAIGIVLMLHFGLFQLLAIAWQDNGRDVQPLMNAPILATSVSDFWGRRWNRPFNVLANHYVFRPLVRPLGAPVAMLATFVASGLVHDLVISVPAGGGYGLPTLYFLIQSLAVLAERSRPLRNLKSVLARRAWAIGVVAGPAPLLLHPTFVSHVLIPMLRAFKAL